MRLTADSYRALARSSPWRWRTLRFSYHEHRSTVDAWVRRPGQLLVRESDGSEQYVHGVPYTRSRMFSSDDPDFVPPQETPALHPHEVPPVLRPDGLVAERPTDWVIEYDDPMYRDYRWVAMLDPVELSHHTRIDDVRAEDRGGREVWRATVRAELGYDPRCGCCSLLWSEISDQDEFHGDPERLARVAETTYPEAYDVALDVRTGVVVSLEPIGSDGAGRGFDLRIHGVDEDFDTVFAGR